MAMNAFLFSLKPTLKALPSLSPPTTRSQLTPPPPVQPRNTTYGFLQNPKAMVGLLGVGAGLTLTLMGPASAIELGSFQLSEPSNALSLPTWAVHVSSVVEWITAMALVWQYGEISGNESWKGLSWGTPAGGSILCVYMAFLYNSESLEVLVALQAALTVLGNATMCLAAFRIYKSSEERSKEL
uniref:Ycf49-like protein n=1 Tax=Cannabis sativa TaxID=3483 RepID=A0A803QSH9_CANSA